MIHPQRPSTHELKGLQQHAERSGQLLPIQYRDESGRVITEFVGNIRNTFAPFMTSGQTVKLNTK